METLVSWSLVTIAIVLTTAVVVFSVEIVAATALRGRPKSVLLHHGVRKRIAVLVPAHNESVGLIPTLVNIQSQSLPGDRILVVADNCSDDTAAIALAEGAEVVERNEPTKLGKGYALDWGIRHLSSDPPEIIVIVDADCRLADGAIDGLALTCAMSGRPVQALYLMAAPVNSQINYQVAEFAWRVKNWLRPLGLRALELPCQLMGSGMAFPWDVIRSADLANGQIVEDLKLGLDLTLAGHPPVFCPSARVTSEFASSIHGAATQRKRWELGHIHMILMKVPSLLIIAIGRRNWDLFAIALDLAVPPLSLLGILVLGIFGCSFLYAIVGYSSAAFAISTVSVIILAMATLLAWLNCGRDILPFTSLLLIPSHAFWKLKLYLQFIFGKFDPQWTRTDRTK
jgi:cellulose synthase/poly-beta-1,6-N-acetylglucosamine synthase-like glycosyltransferase